MSGFVRCCLIASFALTGFARGAEQPAQDRAPPNVLLIVSDDQAWTDFGFMGHPTIRTPHLDALAAESATFTAGYVPTSLCRPSLVTLLTGLYPHQHGVTGNDPPKGVDRRRMAELIRAAPKVPALLAGAGYVSLQTGKWWEGNYENGGFTDGMTHGDPARAGRHGDVGLQIGRQGLQPIWNFLDSRQGKPFFVWYAPFLPHQPHNPPERLLKKYLAADRPIELAKYYAMCEWLDEAVGELLGGLDERGLTDDTLVIFLADNGWIQKTPQTELPAGWKQPFAPKSKRSPYDGGLRTPILVRWPGRITPRRFEAPVSSVDIAPTILKACGVTPPAVMSGEDLVSIAAGGPQRGVAFGAVYEHDMVALDRPTAGLLFRWCRNGDRKLILPADGKHPELYDLAADPHEERNLAVEAPDRVGELRSTLTAWWADTGSGEIAPAAERK